VREPEDILRDVWSWLPAFKAVAERGSVSAAARALHVSPSAVSRVIKSLEGNLEVTLFDRSDKGLALRPEAEILLDAMRSTEQSILGGIRSLLSEELALRISVGTMGSLNRILANPTCAALKANEFPRLVSTIHSDMSPQTGFNALKQGVCDVYLAMNVSADASVTSVDIRPNPMGLYVGKGHPAFDLEPLTLDAILEHPFCAQRPYEGMDSIWPTSIKRRIDFVVDTHSVGLDMCTSGQFVVVLARRVAAPHVEAGTIREFVPDFIVPPMIKAFLRPGTENAPVLSAFLKQLRQVSAAWAPQGT
jgi:DNA-binding transcriptional LysR family regulator